MLNESEWIVLLALAAATSFTPGPNTTLSATLGAQGGFRHALPFVLAVPTGWGLLFGMSAAGLGSLLVAAPWFKWGVILLGTVYLLWLAMRLWTTQTVTSMAPLKRLKIGFWLGIGLQFVNIKAWFLTLSVAAGWVAGHPDPLLRFGMTLPVLCVNALLSNSLYAWVGARLSVWLNGPIHEGLPTGRRLCVFNRVMAAVLMATAMWMLWSSA